MAILSLGDDGLKRLRSRFERFCYANRNIGIPNLMLYVALGSAIVYILSMFDRSYTLYYMLCFNRELILRGQVWRLFTYVFTYDAGNMLLTAVSLLCYYSLGRAIENLWGTFRFNLFYFAGMILMDAFCLIFGGYATVTNLNLSLFLAYATLYPNAHFLLFFIIPVKAWIFAVIDLALVIFQVFAYPFPYNLFPVVALLNYFLFFGKDVLNVFPVSWQVNFSRLFKKKPRKQKKTGTIPFPNAGSYEASVSSVKAPYTHRCTVCGRTDISHPDLEFRYCSRCSGYHCYCQEHINTHEHIN